MRTTRRLRLEREMFPELTATDLGAVVAGQETVPTGDPCQPDALTERLVYQVVSRRVPCTLWCGA